MFEKKVGIILYTTRPVSVTYGINRKYWMVEIQNSSDM